MNAAMLSYGKDSISMLFAIKELGLPLDRIVTADVWATDDIPADLPPMVQFKEYADKRIKEIFGIDVEHICAMKNGEKVTYEKMFYHIPKRKNQLTVSSSREREREQWLGFPMVKGAWCNSRLKVSALQRVSTNHRSVVRGPENNCVFTNGGTEPRNGGAVSRHRIR